MVPSTSLPPSRVRVLAATVRIPSIFEAPVTPRVFPFMSTVTLASIIKPPATVTAPPSVFIPAASDALRLG